jgi:hypothetical protein
MVCDKVVYGAHTIALIEGSAIKDLWGSNVGKTIHQSVVELEEGE